IEARGGERRSVGRAYAPDEVVPRVVGRLTADARAGDPEAPAAVHANGDRVVSATLSRGIERGRKLEPILVVVVEHDRIETPPVNRVRPNHDHPSAGGHGRDAEALPFWFVRPDLGPTID